MSNSNLPPGVSASDIPGNRLEDIEWEKFYEWIDKISEQNAIDVKEFKKIIRTGLSIHGKHIPYP